MDKKIVVLVQPGLPYRKTIRYGNERAREIGAKLVLLVVIPDLEGSEKMAFATYEFGPYEAYQKSWEQDIRGFFERAIQYCLDQAITVETLVERGATEAVIRRLVRDKGIRLVAVPTPTREKQHSAYIDTLREFAHNMLEHELCCPVVSVLAT